MWRDRPQKASPGLSHFVIEASSPKPIDGAEDTMIRAFVTSMLSGMLLLAASPAVAEKAPPRAAKTRSDVRPVPTAQSARAGHEAHDSREAAGRSLRLGPQGPHPFRGQVAAEGRV
jgi:hypothetical protein